MPLKQLCKKISHLMIQSLLSLSNFPHRGLISFKILSKNFLYFTRWKTKASRICFIDLTTIMRKLLFNMFHNKIKDWLRLMTCLNLRRKEILLYITNFMSQSLTLIHLKKKVLEPYLKDFKLINHISCPNYPSTNTIISQWVLQRVSLQVSIIIPHKVSLIRSCTLIKTEKSF